MTISSNLLTEKSGIPNLKTIQYQQDAIQRTLDKAEALGIVATLVDFGATCPNLNFNCKMRYQIILKLETQIK